jgi:DNA-binding CsgD family transcriptional regulator
MREVGMRAIPRGARSATRAVPAALTARERPVLALLADGLVGREISARLFISGRTVTIAVRSKIGVWALAAAAREAARAGHRTLTCRGHQAAGGRRAAPIGNLPPNMGNRWR